MSPSDKTESYEPDSLGDLLPIYYKKYFPSSLYCRWLSYAEVKKDYLGLREFSFTLKDDVYIRYLSFQDEKELMRELVKRCPHKIDIGAVFTHRPKLHKTIKPTLFQAVEKELVFDIDMTDYDDVRSCCSGGDICRSCWPLMTIAIKIIDAALRDDFGFEHIMWVYSGRRGIHCWICDEGARGLSQNSRSAIADYLTHVKGGENQTKKVNISHLHPSLKRALSTVDDHFKHYAVECQDFIGSEEKFQNLLSLIPDDSIRKDITEYLSRFSEDKLTSYNRWETVCKYVNRKLETGDLRETRRLQNVLSEIKLQFTYPRLDVNVTKGVNHLLKSPFCIHPKTGRVCVPIDVRKIDTFDPFSVPTVSQLCMESSDKNGELSECMKAWKDSMRLFEDFVEKIEMKLVGRVLSSDEAMEST